MHNLIIIRKHIKGITFDHRRPGGLIIAARQQQPELNLCEENDGFCYDEKRNRYEFNSSDDKGYSRKSFAALKENKIKEIRVTLVRNNIY